MCAPSWCCWSHGSSPRGLPRQRQAFDGPTRFYAPGERVGAGVSSEAQGVWLGAAVTNSDRYLVPWSAVEIFFERERARRAAASHRLDEAVARVQHAFAVAATQGNCHDFLAHDQCDRAPLTYELSLYEHLRGHDERANLLLHPLARLNPARLYADLLSSPSPAPLFEVAELARLRHPVATYLPEAHAVLGKNGAVRNDGTPPLVAFFYPGDADVCRYICRIQKKKRLIRAASAHPWKLWMDSLGAVRAY